MKSGSQLRNSSFEISANPHSSTLLAEAATFEIFAKARESAFFRVRKRLPFEF